MSEKYYLLNHQRLFKRDEVFNSFELYDESTNTWVSSGWLMDRYYDAAADTIEISEVEAKAIVKSHQKEE